MFEITYKENAITDPTFTDEGACYDFTFENRYDILTIKKHMTELVAQSKVKFSGVSDVERIHHDGCTRWTTKSLTQSTGKETKQRLRTQPE